MKFRSIPFQLFRNFIFSKTLVVAFLLSVICSSALKAQTVIKPVNLDGPRVGCTYIFAGSTATTLKKDYNAQPFITQFGWQFEQRYFTLSSGTCGLVEFVPLVGGLEQGLFLPSASCLVGIRNKNGYEFHFGPNLSLSGASFVVAAGMNFQSGGVNFPVNIAVVPATSGLRISLLFGFNAQHD